MVPWGSGKPWVKNGRRRTSELLGTQAGERAEQGTEGGCSAEAEKGPA